MNPDFLAGYKTYICIAGIVIIGLLEIFHVATPEQCGQLNNLLDKVMMLLSAGAGYGVAMKIQRKEIEQLKENCDG